MRKKQLLTATLVTALTLSPIPAFAGTGFIDSIPVLSKTTTLTDAADTLLDQSNITIKQGQVYDLSQDKNAAVIKALTEGTIIIQYTSTGTEDFQSLFSVSNSTAGNENRHFHIYITPSGTLGMELRNTDQVLKYSLSRPASLRRLYKQENASNTIAFKADKLNKEYKIFANGQLIDTLKVNDFKFLSDITGTDKISLGGTIRGGAVKYPFGGTIENIKILNTALSDDELENETAVTTYGQTIFNSHDSTNSNYFRIPALITLKNGTLASAADARYGGTHDSKSNIDIAFSKSTDGGKTWSDPVLPMTFDDYAYQRIDWPRDVAGRDKQISGSASFIDPVLLEDQDTGRIYLFADAMPAGVGSPNAIAGSGYKEIDGKKYLKLRWYTDPANTYNYTVRENGIVYNDTTNQPTEYTVNANHEILKDGAIQKVKQYQVRFDGNNLIEEKTNKDVNMNVFYKDSVFKILPTAYFSMTYSDDEGKTWSPLKLMNKDLKSETERLFITGPGKGIQVQNGPHKGRLVAPIYTITDAGFGVIYSDDHGSTWHHAKGPYEASAATAEAQVVEMPDGSLKAFERTGSGKIAMITSLDSGVTWTNRVLINELPATSYGTQVSAINYSGMIDGKPAIILSAPNSVSGRKDGRIRIGLITETGQEGVDKYRIDWTYDYAVDGPQIGYSYSCLTELPNHNIGVLYEKYDSWSRNELHLKDILVYEEYSISDLTNK